MTFLDLMAGTSYRFQHSPKFLQLRHRHPFNHGHLRTRSRSPCYISRHPYRSRCPLRWLRPPLHHPIHSHSRRICHSRLPPRLNNRAPLPLNLCRLLRNPSLLHLPLCRSQPTLLRNPLPQPRNQSRSCRKINPLPSQPVQVELAPQQFPHPVCPRASFTPSWDTLH
jgi:hypothetical protein